MTAAQTKAMHVAFVAHRDAERRIFMEAFALTDADRDEDEKTVDPKPTRDWVAAWTAALKYAKGTK